MESIGEVIKEIKESKRGEFSSALNVIECQCGACGLMFEALSIHDITPDYCNQCADLLTAAQRTCENCGAGMIRIHDPKTNISAFQCRRCVDPKSAKEASDMRADMAFYNLCPKRYRDFNLFQAVAERDDAGALMLTRNYKQIMNWGTGKELPELGLLATGPSGECKTFMLYSKLRDMIRRGRTVQAFECDRFSHEVSKRFGTGEGEAWIDSLLKVDILFLDDVGKSVWTERYKSELFGIIERRTARGLPLFITTNEDSNTLAERINDPQMADAILRRLNQFCFVIPFTETVKVKK